MDDNARGLPDLAELPRRCDRRTAAALLTKYFFKTSHRTLERWPLSWWLLNGRAHCETAELFELAASMLAQAPCIRGGRLTVTSNKPSRANPTPPEDSGPKTVSAVTSRPVRRSRNRRRHNSATKPEVLA